MKKKLCTREGCTNHAVYQAGVRAWAQGMPKTDENAGDVLFTVYTCVEHSQEIMQLEYMEEWIWISFARRFKLAKGVPPAWRTAEGFLQEIESGKRTYRNDPRPH